MKRLNATSYVAAARRMRLLADRIEQHCRPTTPRELASLTRAIHAASMHAKHFSEVHRNRGVRP